MNFHREPPEPTEEQEREAEARADAIAEREAKIREHLDAFAELFGAQQVYLTLHGVPMDTLAAHEAIGDRERRDHITAYDRRPHYAPHGWTVLHADLSDEADSRVRSISFFHDYTAEERKERAEALEDATLGDLEAMNGMAESEEQAA